MDLKVGLSTLPGLLGGPPDPYLTFVWSSRPREEHRVGLPTPPGPPGEPLDRTWTYG